MKFVVFGEDWGAHPSSTQHLFKELAQYHEIHWFNSIGMRKPSLNGSDLKRVYDKVKKAFIPNSGSQNYAIEKPQNLMVHNPKFLPWHDNIFNQSFNEKVFSTFKFDQGEPVIYWISVPTAMSIINPRPQDKVVYYCGDDFSALAGVDHEMVEPFEAKLIRKADIIYVVSENLSNKMPSDKTQIMSHGVDFELFYKKKKPAPEIKDSEKPTIGFYGSINAWLDTELLYKLATCRPNYQLVLVGDCVSDISDLLKLDNVTHFNAVPHERLAEFSQHWHCSMLPFKLNEQIMACDPLKLKEYMASGTPIVSTRYPAVEKYDDAILIANDHIGFIQRVDMAVTIKGAFHGPWKALQASHARAHSWEAKAQLVTDQLEAF